MYRDEVSYNRIEELHPIIKDKVKLLYDEISNKYNFEERFYRITQGYRTIKQQNSIPQYNTNAKGNKARLSYHIYGLAIDFIVIENKLNVVDIDKDIIFLKTIVPMFLNSDVRWKWGGNFVSLKDYNHLQYLPFGFNSISEVRSKWIEQGKPKYITL